MLGLHYQPRRHADCVRAAIQSFTLYLSIVPSDTIVIAVAQEALVHCYLKEAPEYGIVFHGFPSLEEAKRFAKEVAEGMAGAGISIEGGDLH
jgi:hypothetical protein